MKYIINLGHDKIARVEAFPCPAPVGFEEFKFFIHDAGKWVAGHFEPSGLFRPSVECAEDFLIRLDKSIHPGYATVQEAEKALVKLVHSYDLDLFRETHARHARDYLLRKEFLLANLSTLQ